MVTFESIKNKQNSVCIVGLGYVGLPLAVYLAEHFSVVGFDVDEKRIKELKDGVDRIEEVDSAILTKVKIDYTSDESKINESKFIIVAVPTPIDDNNIPDIRILKSATSTVGKNLSKDSVVVYESTVYPGLTEDICIPILEKESGLKAGVDFKVGYSPERVNPGDKEHTIDKITKVVAGMDVDTTKLLADVYGTITKIHQAPSIKVAEAAKVIENTQRDLNIALVNELAIIFQQMDINTNDVLEAAGTKWNFIKFKPGLVGGHCIGVDPYYLTFKAESLGHHPEVILAGRRINDSMGRYVARQILKRMAKTDKVLRSSRVAILGITFKENVPDIRNSKAVDIYKEFISFGLSPLVYDPLANKAEVKKEYGIDLCKKEDLHELDTIVLAVPHQEFVDMSSSDYKKIMNHNNLLIADLKHVLDKDELKEQGIKYWSL